MASPAPVLPLVGSTIVPPGSSWPARSARSTIARPIRSFTDPPGFRYSTLASRVGARPRPSRDNRTNGVPPTTSRSESYTSIDQAYPLADPENGSGGGVAVLVDPVEQVGLGLAGGHQRPDQGVVLPGVDLGHHLVGDGEPEAVGVDLGGVGDQGVATAAQPAGDVDLGGDDRLGEALLPPPPAGQPLGEGAVDAAGHRPGVDRLHPGTAEGGVVVELERLERRPGLRVATGVGGGVE